MTNLTVKIVDVQTGKEIVRDMTNEELVQYQESRAADLASIAAEEEAKAAAEAAEQQKFNDAVAQAVAAALAALQTPQE
jgi:hypothetical protein